MKAKRHSWNWKKTKETDPRLEVLGKHSGQSRKGKPRKKYQTNNGYHYLFLPNHPFANSQQVVAEHRVVMEKKLGRYLAPHEVVHHLNGIKTDNRPENLEVHTKYSHGYLHRQVDKSFYSTLMNQLWSEKGHLRQLFKNRSFLKKHSVNTKHGMQIARMHGKHIGRLPKSFQSPPSTS